MSAIDYMKVIDVISRLLKADPEVELTSADSKYSSFTVTTPMEDGTMLSYRMGLETYSVTIVIESRYFTPKTFDNFLSKLEYELEQKLLLNIKIKSEEEGGSFLITISI
jgi:hypothetical protein